jgi:hypothetical protein
MTSVVAGRVLRSASPPAARRREIPECCSNPRRRPPSSGDRRVHHLWPERALMPDCRDVPRHSWESRSSDANDQRDAERSCSACDREAVSLTRILSNHPVRDRILISSHADDDGFFEQFRGLGVRTEPANVKFPIKLSRIVQRVDRRKLYVPRTLVTIALWF